MKIIDFGISTHNIPKMKKKIILLFACLIIGVMELVVCGTTPAAPAYPIKPVKILIGRVAGGSTDLVARAIQPYVKDLHKSPDNTFHFFD
jgi:tripartite-type tricarboxylate transporter receptor subunit TctC